MIVNESNLLDKMSNIFQSILCQPYYSQFETNHSHFAYLFAHIELKLGILLASVESTKKLKLSVDLNRDKSLNLFLISWRCSSSQQWQPLNSSSYNRSHKYKRKEPQ